MGTLSVGLLLLFPLAVKPPPRAKPLPWPGPYQKVSTCFWAHVDLDERAKLAFFNWDAIGRRDAESDLKKGTLKLLSFGLLAPWSQEYDRLLKARLGVESEGIAGCVVTRALVDYARGYNEFVRADIERRFGERAIEDTVELARKNYAAKINPSPKKP